MGIRQITPQSEVESYIDTKVEHLREAVIYSFQYVGEAALTQAREWRSQQHPYTDRTGNLRSSVGYIIVDEGRIVGKSGFSAVNQGQEGSGEGEKFARSLASKFTKGISLIFVAGMSYAAYVSARGYDVNESAEDLASLLVPKFLHQLGFN